MSELVDRIVANIVRLEVRLLACQARLEADTDPEALHDLRTTVRRLRSLLRPLRGLPGVVQLEMSASQVGVLTTPLRDLEVLAAHLQAHGYTAQAQRRTQQLAGSYARVADSEQLAQLLMILEVFPRFLRAAEREGLLRGLRQRIAKVLEKQWKTLENALNDPGHDRHRVRLLIKRVRYAAEAYPELNQLQPLVLARLKGAQQALGEWHDAWQWLLQAGQHADLQPCVAQWQATLEHGEKRADKALVKLSAACFHS
ncbi:MAG: CHAD domain-containing protein [Pseudomonas sp.]|uniref:CHAD domain-containing protein n=1 Tax=Pseudomonas sp. TaxID=306 RepID=UPI0026470A8D|nr:CHAD domain-containing protein [Pseudomonas sp.]MDN5392122.1 CHAD domain-containing protein [Pseudomonas sp.]MDN5406864.1 CHAD domain-containing protein [Pseudomonas sp.]MDN5454375.1 CHAD domain-containing protein [Pseudomonas sp.]MDN5457804.1 CHAD domain-containing protein [Pseudomonas sp.]MDN5672119.1 CHAD domain-containing protein [Pseudomonas sp.]